MSKIEIKTNGMDLNFIRLLVMIRDKYKCHIHRLLETKSKCSRDGLHTHHIKSKGGDKPNNLITLCSTHHALVHGLDVSEPFVVKLKFILVKEGISQSHLAKILNISQPAISLMIQAGTCEITKAIKIKDYIKFVTGRKYSIEELFTKMKQPNNHRKTIKQ